MGIATLNPSYGTFFNDARRSIWAHDLATAVLTAAGMIWHLQTVPLSQLGDYFAITDLLVDFFWDADPLSMVAEPITYFDEADWDMGARLNLNLAGAEYWQILDQIGVAKERFRSVLYRVETTASAIWA